jgi:hypothetical protein
MKRRAYLLLFVLFFNSLLWFRPSPAHACQCPEPSPPADAFNYAAAVFTGRVITVYAPLNIPAFARPIARWWPGLYRSNTLYKPRATITVTTSWKGVTSSEVTVISGEGSGCDYGFEKGREYLIYAYQLDSDWFVSPCDTVPVVHPNNAPTFTYLATQPTLPLTAPSSFPWPTVFCGLALFILVAIFGIGWHTRHKRKRESTPAA